eukprot:2200105-Rhodomonas_salina.4
MGSSSAVMISVVGLDVSNSSQNRSVPSGTPSTFNLAPSSATSRSGRFGTEARVEASQAGAAGRWARAGAWAQPWDKLTSRSR